MTLLNSNNYLTLAGYIINTFITFTASPLFGFPNNAELSEKYQTLVTPSGSTFAIWGIIFLSQLSYTVVQMLPDFRDNVFVQEDGVSYWYFVACLFQSAWTFAFGYESITLSVFFMLGILVSLLKIVINQSKIESDPRDRIKDYWLYKFPFYAHCGWITVAFAVNANVLVVSSGALADAQLAWANLTLGYVCLVAAFAFVSLSEPDYTIPSVLVWAVIGIVSELNQPSDDILRTFEIDDIRRFRGLTLALCIILLLFTIGFAIYRNLLILKSAAMNTYEDTNAVVDDKRTYERPAIPSSPA